MQQATVARQFRPWKYLRFGLRTYFLLIALIASWLALRITRSEMADKVAQVGELKQVLGEVQFASITQFGLVKESGLPYNYDWQVFLPDAMKYELCWAVSNIGPEGFPEETNRMKVGPGTHSIRLFPSWESKPFARSYLITLTVDGVDYVLGKIGQSGSRHDCLKDIGVPKRFAALAQSPGSNMWVQGYQQETSKPLEIIRAIDDRTRSDFSRRFLPSSIQEDETEFIQGVLLWVVATPMEQNAK